MAAFKRQITYSQRPNHAARAAHARGDKQFRTYDTSAIKPKQSKAPVVVFAVVVLVVLALIIFGLVTLFRGCSESANPNLVDEGTKVSFVVPEGAGTSTIAQDLYEAGLISSTSDFTKSVSNLGFEGQLKAGTYSLTGGSSIDDLAKTLATGPGMTGNALTIPEGLTLASIADRVAQATDGRVSADEFKNAASNASTYASSYSFLADAGTNSLEGFLFPKTYSISETDTADSIIRAMLTQYQTEVANLSYSYPQGKGYNAYQTLILASIVEKESSDDSDVRAKVAAVFYNRLANVGDPCYGMLGSDATTAYELGEEPTNYDWTTDSPYNTRYHAGLPPTPICSPSLSSLQAVCNPASGMDDYLFFSFWPNSSGGVDYFFDKTYAEHQATIAAHS